MSPIPHASQDGAHKLYHTLWVIYLGPRALTLTEATDCAMSMSDGTGETTGSLGVNSAMVDKKQRARSGK